MVVLLDNYDSFSYNLVQLIGELEPDLRVIRNDEMTCEEILALHPSHLILSPGPGRPREAGICEEAVCFFQGKIPILGVCLGHQAICEALGGQIGHAKKLCHGKQCSVWLESDSVLFSGLGETIPVARYHSLAAKEDLPKELRITARTEDGEIMAVEHRYDPIFGLQFHPESIMTPDGKKMLENFLHSSVVAQ